MSILDTDKSNMNIYEELDYRVILRKTIEERKRVDSSSNFQKLATAIRVQKSYLSKVFRETTDLNTDQLFLACEHLEFTSDQKNYLFLLPLSIRWSILMATFCLNQSCREGLVEE